MQFYALDDKNNVIHAVRASKNVRYKCSICHTHVVLREGIYRKAHFYHINFDRICASKGKGAEHLAIQKFVQKKLNSQDCFLEYPFPEINRIADLAYFPKKIVFEIQCSYISKEEFELRSQNYQSIGWQVIWLFNDKLYNKKIMKSVELSALKTPHYFVNISSDGSITIYDQLHNHLKNFRYQKSAPLKLSILRPKIFTQTGSKNYPKNILLRTNHWKAHLEQDYLTILPKISLNSSYLDKQFLGTVLNRLKVVSKKIATPFKALFHFILESACKKFLI